MRMYLGGERVKTRLWTHALIGTLIVFVSGTRLMRIAAEDGEPAGPDPGDLEEMVDTFMADHAGEFDGLGVVVVQGKEVILSKGYGFADFEAQMPVDPARTVYRGASVGKVFVTAAVLQLVEQGQLTLDTDVNTIFTQFQLDQPVTVRQLLTHTGAVESTFIGAEVADEADLISMEEFFGADPPAVNYPPGEFISYSNHGMALAGHVVEVVSGMTFYDYADQYLFEPLEMDRATFRQPLPVELERSAADFAFDDFVIPYPSATLAMPPEQMSHFIIALLNVGTYGNEQFLQPETVDLFLRQQVTPHPSMPGVALGFFEHYGYGQRALFHTGLRHHSAILFIVPEADLGFYLVGSIPEGSPLKSEFVDAFQAFYFPEVNEVSEQAERAAGDRNPFTGFYRMHAVPLTCFEKVFAFGTDALVVQDRAHALWLRLPIVDEPVELVDAGNGLFRTRPGLRYLTFREDEQGRHLFISGGISDVFSLTRIRWYQSGIFNLSLAGLGFVSLLSYFPVSLAAALVRRSGKPKLPTRSRRAVLGWRLTGLAIVLTLAGPASLIGWVIANGGPGLSGVPPVFYVMESLLLLGSLVGLGVPLYAVLGWREGWGTHAQRLYVTWLGTVFVVMPFWLNAWNLIGYRF